MKTMYTSHHAKSYLCPIQEAQGWHSLFGPQQPHCISGNAKYRLLIHILGCARIPLINALQDNKCKQSCN